MYASNSARRSAEGPLATIERSPMSVLDEDAAIGSGVGVVAFPCRKKILFSKLKFAELVEHHQ